MSYEQSIAAPITAPGQAPVSILRVSGPAVCELIRSLCARSEEILSSARCLVATEIWDRLSQDGQPRPLDEGLVAFFPAPNSFTGEDCVEFQVHGSRYIVSRLLENFTSLGIRLAEPGEFSKRAFLKGRIDLSQAEAVADIINAQTELQARLAQEQLQGKLSGVVSGLGEPLRDLLAEIEANIDFPEEDIEPLSAERWKEVLLVAQEELKKYIDSYETGRLYREGASVVIAGLPNAGKSSLLNCIAGENRVIVSDAPGTTRDSIEEQVSIDGLLVRLCDTAGISGAELDGREIDELEKLGVERSWRQVVEADLILFLIDAQSHFQGERLLLEKVRAKNSRLAIVLSKGDLLGSEEAEAILKRASEELDSEVLITSARTTAGISELRAFVREALIGGSSQADTRLISTARHHQALRDSHQAISRTLSALDEGLPAELISLELRFSLGALDEIIGVTPTEDILGRIFSKFCIGK